MNWPASLPRRSAIRLAAATGIVVVCAGALGWRAGETAPPAALPLAKESGSTGALARDDVAKDVAVLTSRRPWGGPNRRNGPERARQERVQPWRLAGIIERGSEKFALIASGSGRAVRFDYRKIGEAFPDGSILMQITPDSAKTKSSSSSGPSDSATTHVYRLFNKKP